MPIAPHPSFHRRVLAAALGVLAAMSAAAAAPLAPGAWGGDRVNLLVEATGARLDYDCAAARIDRPLKIDAAGRFAATGRFEAFGHGPVDADAPPATRPARFEGHVVADTLELVMRVGDDPPLRHRLTRGRRIKLVRCM